MLIANWKVLKPFYYYYQQVRSPRIHFSAAYLTAVRGRLTRQKSRSEAASETTKSVVACVRSRGQRSRATTVKRLPTKKRIKHVSLKLGLRMHLHFCVPKSAGMLNIHSYREWLHLMPHLLFKGISRDSTDVFPHLWKSVSLAFLKKGKWGTK